MFYQEYLPCEALRNVVACYWKFVAPEHIREPFQHTAPPDGCVSLFLHRNVALQIQYLALASPSVEVLKTTVLPGSVYLGVRFLPGAFGCFFDIDLEMLRNQGQAFSLDTPFTALLPSLNADFNDFDQLDAILLQLKQSESDTEVQKAVQLILDSQGQCKIKDIVSQAFVSERPLQKRFRRAVGLSMKEFARVRRMRTAIVQMVLHQQRSLDVSHEGGYYDQAHFLRDFQAFAQMKPSELQDYLRRIAHGDIHW